MGLKSKQPCIVPNWLSNRLLWFHFQETERTWQQWRWEKHCASLFSIDKCFYLYLSLLQEPRPLYNRRCQFYSSGIGFLYDAYQTEVNKHFLFLVWLSGQVWAVGSLETQMCFSLNSKSNLFFTVCFWVGDNIYIKCIYFEIGAILIPSLSCSGLLEYICYMWVFL